MVFKYTNLEAALLSIRRELFNFIKTDPYCTMVKGIKGLNRTLPDNGVRFLKSIVQRRKKQKTMNDTIQKLKNNDATPVCV